MVDLGLFPLSSQATKLRQLPLDIDKSLDQRIETRLFGSQCGEQLTAATARDRTCGLQLAEHIFGRVSLVELSAVWQFRLGFGS